MRSQNKPAKSFAMFALALLVSFSVGIAGLGVQRDKVQRDPAEPPRGKPAPKLPPRSAGAIARNQVDESGMRSLIEQLVACGTRNSLSSWSDPKRGAGCGRDHIAARLNEIANNSGGKLQVVVDQFEATSARTSNKPAHMENVYGLLPGRDPLLAKTIFIVSGHFDSRASESAARI